MRSAIAVALTAGALLSDTPAAVAQSSSRVTVTPYISFGTETAPPVGVLVTVPVRAGLSAESEVAYRRGEGNIHAMSSSLSLVQNLPKIGVITPYVAVGAGVAQYGEPVFGQAGAPIGTARRLGLMVNGGGGIRVPVNSGMEFRTDLRYLDGLGVVGDQFRIANGISFKSR